MSEGRSTEVMATNLGFTEGPVLAQDGSVVVTAIDRGLLYRLHPSGMIETLAKAEAGLNGATEGRDGVFYMTHFWGAPPAPRGVVSVGGIVSWGSDAGLRWVTRDPISPNDLCFGPDGQLYISDPTRPRRADGRIWRCDPDTGEAHLLTSVPWYPNGVGFGLEDDVLYVADSFGQRIMRFALDGENPIGQGEIVIQMDRGVPDGFAFDVLGNIIIGAPSLGHDGPGTIQTWNPQGELLDVFIPGDSRLYTNVALSHNSVLYITDAEYGSVLRVTGWPTAGLALHPFR
jgi:gluconolactonase